MRKFEKLFFMALLLVTVLGYNNCGKVQFTPAQSNSTASTTSNNPQDLPPSGVLSFGSRPAATTIAFNDNYPSTGDEDYNDFVTNLNVTETYNNAGGLTQIVIVYSPLYKISASDHQFVLVFDGVVHGNAQNETINNISALMKTQPMFNDSQGQANINYQLVDTNNKTLASNPNYNKDIDLVVFPSTYAANGETNYSNGVLTQTAPKQIATIAITNIDPSQNSLANRGPLSILRYRSLLTVPNGGKYYDIDISDIGPSFLDGSGNPGGFFVPVNWRPPGEGQNITQIYPEFSGHSLYLQSGAPLNLEPASTAQWYNDAAANFVNLLAPLVPVYP